MTWLKTAFCGDPTLKRLNRERQDGVVMQINSRDRYTRAVALALLLDAVLARSGPFARAHSITRAGARFCFSSAAMKRMYGSM
jgi:hypothetical protein